MWILNIIIILTIIFLYLMYRTESFLIYQNCIRDGTIFHCQLDKEKPIYHIKNRYNRFHIPDHIKVGLNMCCDGYWR